MNFISRFKHLQAKRLVSIISRCAITASLFLLAAPLQAADLSIYIDSDFNPATGCGGQGAEVLIEATTSPSPQYTVDSLQVSNCVSDAFGPPAAAPAGFPAGLNNGIDGSDVVELAVALNLLGLDGDELINAVVVVTAPGSTDTVIPLPRLDLVTGAQAPGPTVDIPSGSTIGILLLTALLALAALYYLRGTVRGVTVMLVLISGALVAQAPRFVADGYIDDWIGWSPASANPAGSGSPLSEVRQLFFATEGPDMFVRLDITEIEAPELSGADPGFGPTAGGFTVELSGQGFLSTGTTVTVDGTDCTAVTFIDPARLTCIMPAHATGLADIVVTTPAGQSAPLQFNYQDPKLTTLITGTAQVISFHTVQLTGAVATVTTATPTFQWTQIFGEPVSLIGANTPDLSFEAPGVSIGQSLEFRLDTSADGISGHATHVVTISPEMVGVDAGADVQTITGTPVSFHAVGHSEGGALTWAWAQLEGDVVTINGADSPNATFTTPANAGTLKFEVTVTDPASVAASDIVEVTVSLASAPAMHAASVVAALSGELVQLQVSVAGGLPAGATLAWTQVKGPAVTLQGDDGLTPTFTAPVVQQPTELEFRAQMTTTQGSGAVTYVTARIHPKPDTSPIHVDAGKDQRAESGDTIQLHVDVLSGVTTPVFEWKQIPVPGGLPAGLTGSRQATLVNANAQNVTLQLPTIPDTPDNLGNRMAFQVTVSQGLRLGTDVVEVDLRKLRVDAKVADQFLLGRSNAFPGETVHLTSGIRNSKAPVTVTWTQTAGPAATLSDADKPDASAELTQLGDYTFEVDVTDALGNAASDTVSVSAIDRAPPPKVVIPPVSQLTVAVTGGSTSTSNQTFEADQGIMAEVHYAGEITPPTITWAQTLGPVVTWTPGVDGKTITFDAPLVTADTRLGFEVTVDDTDKVVTAPVDYLILDRAISLTIGTVADSYTGKSNTLHGTASGGGGTLSYQWTQVSNGAPTVPLQDFATSTAHVTATQAGTYVFELAVSDNLNNMGTAQVTAHVDPVPAPPAQTTAPIAILFPPVIGLVEGNQVTYDAVINNLPAGALVTWTEVLGKVDPSPTPDPADASIVNLTLPAVDADSVIQLKVTVTDGIGGPVLKEATSPRLTVRDRAIFVSGQVTGSGRIMPNDTVHLSASNVQGAFGAVTYQWVLKSGTGNLSGANTATPTFVPDKEETAKLEVTATDALGNTASAIVPVIVAPPLSFKAPADENRDWPADAASSPVTLHLAPTGGSGQFRFDHKLQIYNYQFKRWDDHKPGGTLDFDFDVSNPTNPIVSLTDRFFNGASNANCDGVPCDTVKGRLQSTVTDTQTGETQSGTTNIKWEKVTGPTPAQVAINSATPTVKPGECTVTKNSQDRISAFKAAWNSGAPIKQEICHGPVQICEKLFGPRASTGDETKAKKVYGLLHIVNTDSGARTISREFGNYNKGYREWYLGSSDSDRCSGFNFGNIYTVHFECWFAYRVAFGNANTSENCQFPMGNRDIMLKVGELTESP